MNATADKVGFVPEPNGRGTIGLLWSCFATIFLCTWSAIHPNLPAIDDSPSRIFWRKVEYMLVAVIAPEYMASLAFVDFMDVREMRKKRPLSHPLSGEPWTYTQYHHLLMGGFTVQYDPHDPSKHRRINPVDLLDLLETKVVEMPYTDNSDIEDQSKANWFTRSITLLQVAWFIVQLSGRAAQRLPVSTLELFTLGLVICAAYTYICWWNKPLDVQKPVVLKLSDGKIIPPTVERCLRVGFLEVHRLTRDSILDAVFVVGLILLFGAAHIIGWNFEFPTELERLLWRISSLCSAILPLVVLVSFYFLEDTKFWGYNLTVLGGLYVIVRLYLFAEMFAGLRAAPAGLYQTPQWSQYFPAFG